MIRVGIRVLKDGGNAIDAAIATALCVSVVDPGNPDEKGEPRGSRSVSGINASETYTSHINVVDGSGKYGCPNSDTVGWIRQSCDNSKDWDSDE